MTKKLEQRLHRSEKKGKKGPEGLREVIKRENINIGKVKNVKTEHRKGRTKIQISVKKAFTRHMQTPIGNGYAPKIM